jgi:formyltetrahydrofolate deformylase
MLIAVSKASHCLNDLLHRWHTRNLPVDLAGVVSNHPDLAELTGWYQVPFHHLPVDENSREAQESELLKIFEQTGSDYLILARYMQVLSTGLAQTLAGRCINIHHSFLPGFKGARPYARARERGVKLIGATAQYVTSELDEGRSSSRQWNAWTTVPPKLTLSALGGTSSPLFWLVPCVGLPNDGSS